MLYLHRMKYVTFHILKVNLCYKDMYLKTPKSAVLGMKNAECAVGLVLNMVHIATRT